MTISIFSGLGIKFHALKNSCDHAYQFLPNNFSIFFNDSSLEIDHPFVICLSLKFSFKISEKRGNVAILWTTGLNKPLHTN